MATPDKQEFITRLVDVLDGFHRLTGDRRFARAVSALTGNKPGRPVIDDGRALEFAQSLLDADLARSRNDAADKAAKFFRSGYSAEADKRRLFRNLKNDAQNN